MPYRNKLYTTINTDAITGINTDNSINTSKNINTNNKIDTITNTGAARPVRRD
jgi:hypothetical protein